MTGFDWEVLVVGLAAGLGVGLIALTAIRRRTRRAQLAQADSGIRRRRINVVAIDEDAERSPERERNA